MMQTAKAWLESDANHTRLLSNSILPRAFYGDPNRADVQRKYRRCYFETEFRVAISRDQRSRMLVQLQMEVPPAVADNPSTRGMARDVEM
jgi:hypothetical protein